MPILLAALSVNQRLPSGPLAMPMGALAAVGIVLAGEKADDDVTNESIAFAPFSVNQRFPSGPFVMPYGPAPEAVANSPR